MMTSVLQVDRLTKRFGALIANEDELRAFTGQS